MPQYISAGTITYETRRGLVTPSSLLIFSNSRLPTDPLKQVVVTLYGLHDGSEIRVYDYWSNEVVGIEALSGSEFQMSLNYYGENSPYNRHLVVIFHLQYAPIRFYYDSPVFDSRIPIFQIRDKWYENP